MCRLEVAAGDGAFEFAAESKEANHHLRGLQANTTYRIRIAAQTACGHPGDWSDVLTVSTPPMPPLAPAAVAAEAHPGSIRKGKPTCTLAVSWEEADAADTAHAPPAFFEAEALDAASRAVRARHTTSKPIYTALLPGLQPAMAYTVRVRAVAAGSVGASTWSAGVRVETPAPAPIGPVVSLGSSPRTMSVEFGATDSQRALEVQSQSSEGGTPRCGVAGSAAVAAIATPPRKPSPAIASAPAPRRRVAAPPRQRMVVDAPTARGPPRRRAKYASSMWRSSVPFAVVALSSCAIALMVLAVMRSM